MNLKPIGDRIIVEPIDEESTTASGIVVPDTAKEKPQKGKVVAVGSGKYVDDELVPLEVKVDDTILFARYSPTEIKLDGKEYFILKEEDVLAVVEGGK